MVQTSTNTKPDKGQTFINTMHANDLLTANALLKKIWEQTYKRRILHTGFPAEIAQAGFWKQLVAGWGVQTSPIVNKVWPAQARFWNSW